MNCVIKTPDGKTQVHSINKSTVSIGRSKSCDIPIFSDSLSRIHCQIFEENGEFFIMDLNSTNGVFINDERIDPNKKIRLISFLNVKIAFLYELTIVPEHQIHEEKKELLSFVETTKTKNSFSRVTKPKADSSKRRETQLDGK